MGTGLLYYALTSVIVVLGVVFGHDFLPRPAHVPAAPADLLSSFAAWDGRWYRQIVAEGYSYDPHARSNVAFLPAYPVLGRLLVARTGWRPELALLVVAHLSLAGTFMVLIRYVRQRFPDAPRELSRYVVLALGLSPTTCFFRMAYSESLFVLCTALAMYAMERRWSLPAIAGIIGFATATRVVGVALLVPLLFHLRDRSPGARVFLARLVFLLPLACWGLAAYMGYLFVQFHDPLAFARTQAYWSFRPTEPLFDKIVNLASYEPLWSVFDPASPCFWQRAEPSTNPLFSLRVANPCYFVLTVALLLLGAIKGWLTRYELSLAIPLLLIPYVTRSHEMCMGGMGRFAAVVLPVYLVLGQLLRRVPPPLAAVLLSLSGCVLGAYAALFASWHHIY